MLRALVLRALLRARRLRNRARLAWLCWLNPGIEVHATASRNFAGARFNVAPGGRLRIGPRAATEDRPGALAFLVAEGGEIEVGEGTWLRTEVGAIHLAAYAGGRMEIGAGSLLNGCQLSAKRSLRLGRRVWIGPGTRVFDSDQHDLDDARPEAPAPVAIGECAWIASDCLVVKGVTIGAHAVVGARSLVTRDVPPHTLVYGAPAEPRGAVGDRSRAR
jgi:carbonic anhydrase/acetyltransferase-like protein (isoleucine patch superfamily)